MPAARTRSPGGQDGAPLAGEAASEGNGDETMSNIYVLYHAGCNDGFGAAWIAHKHLGDIQDGRRVRYLPQSYGGEPPRMDAGSRIYILDFSYPLETMLELHRQHESVILLDHHETARDALEGRVPDCHFDLERSGATIAWEYWGSGFSTNEGELLARYIEDRDLWRWKLPDSREVSAALDSHPKRFRVWDRLDVETLAREGTGILRYIRTQTENLAGMAQEQELAGYPVPVVNTSLLGSETCEALLERHPEAEFAATYWERDGRRHWSLRSRADGDFDVAQIALKRGGGGHPHAAGFTEEPGRWEPMNPAD